MSKIHKISLEKTKGSLPKISFSKKMKEKVARDYTNEHALKARRAPWFINSGRFFIVCGVINFAYDCSSSIPSLVIGYALYKRGTYLRNLSRNLEQYLNIMNDRLFCKISKFAQFTKQDEEQVIKDLERLIKRGVFREGYLNDEKTYFMLSYEIYNDYLESKKYSNDKSTISHLENDLQISKKYVKEIKQLSIFLQEDELFLDLTKLIDTSNKIINHMEKNPNKIEKLSKFSNHYLPMTLKLINTYKDIISQKITNENAINSKAQIKKSIDSINVAFKNLFDNLYEDVSIDVESDISVLEMLFEQDGLSHNKF